ncbi:TetR/AcrR family transcriptional regulator [Actinacidiphila bryophytorum]|jgi:AcrR family transcriptional regulator|uniref:TetR/AcrR family transcriptional regulator n=1 Tax=Actinacidiphila bryophytorum TaxID=1436133 RepID=UPI002176E8EC|nr:TetR/AcrR family transcriptional regulator [Actinacidiphila bryophytorum]UWE10565.1 TetR/AcrR family transcriptional regulator [Actinacidiphila bryophytorum]
MNKSDEQEPVRDASGRGPGSRATREKLMAAAAELIAEVGWGRVTTRAVAERAGLPLGSVSYHFRGKQELLVEACTNAFSDAVPFEEFAAVAGVSDLIDMIGAQLGHELETTPALTRLMFEAMREAERDEMLRERLGAMINEYRQAVVQAVRADQQRHVVPATVSAEGIATLVTALGDGLLLHALLDPGTRVTDTLDALRALLGLSTGSRP